MIGDIEQGLGLSREPVEKKSLGKVNAPSFDQLEAKNIHN
jgi:hypothetical protein